MSYALVIVESPAKAKTISGYLGEGYVVESSIGHIRDLPVRASEVPAAYKAESWSSLGIDVENDFKPLYVVNAEKKDQIRRLRRLLVDANELYLATDEDREGEAIAWHLFEVLNPTVPVRRMVFHEITPEAIRHALDDTREIDRRLVDAQEARRLLDRLYGYEISPVLWKKITTGLSAGRVQSVATRIVVERERGRMSFVPAQYWDLDFNLTLGETTFTASLQYFNNQRVAAGGDFDNDGHLTKEVVVLDEYVATDLAQILVGSQVEVSSVEPKPYRRRPAPPFITSTFQQEAGRRLKLSATLAMHTAQSLYQKGYITYMRTDSTTLSDAALHAARDVVLKQFGVNFLPETPRTYQSKVRNAQEAHEAIRPAGDSFRHPDEIASELSLSEARVYEMIWKRTVASQMTDAIGETVQVRFSVFAGNDEVLLAASGTTITHPGFRSAYIETPDESHNAANGDQESFLPEMESGDSLIISEAVPVGHATQPPARFTEASLVKRLEDLGVGRPSTYASIIETIQGRDYVWRKGAALVPTLSAFAVTTLLERHFPRLVDYDFTAAMESDLDDIASGKAETVPWLRKFYFGSEEDIGLQAKVTTRLGEIDPKGVSTVPLGMTNDGRSVVACYGKFGAYVEIGDKTASIPDDLAPDELTVERALEFLDVPTERYLGDDPETGLRVTAKTGKFGPYVSLGQFPQMPSLSSPSGRLQAQPLHRKELRVALAYARSFFAVPDDEAIRRAVVSPKRGVGKGALDRLASYAETNGVGLAEAFEYAEQAGVTGAALKGVREFLDIRTVVNQSHSRTASETLREVLKASGYLQELRDSGDKNRIEIIETFFQTIDEFSSLEEMLIDLDRISDLERQPKPKTASLFQSMTLERVTLEDALELLSLPRLVGIDPEDGLEITVQNGRFGPYLKKGGDSRSLGSEEQLLSISLSECLEILEQPKVYGRARANPPLGTFGVDPVSGKEILLKDGRFGLYVTDGETNASLRRGDSPEELSDERAIELLAERRAKGPAKKKSRKGG